MNVDEFDFELPERLIAQTPLADRTASRLLALNKQTGEIGHHSFTELAEHAASRRYARLNDTRVMPARLARGQDGYRRQGGAASTQAARRATDGRRWRSQANAESRRQADLRRRWHGRASAASCYRERREMGARDVEFQYEGIFQELLDRLGEMPLPPYIKERLDDRERYQTVYAKHEGSAAAPTAGLAFHEDVS